MISEIDSFRSVTLNLSKDPSSHIQKLAFNPRSFAIFAVTKPY